MSKADFINMLKTDKRVFIGFSGHVTGEQQPVYLTPEFATQLAEALETPEPAAVSGKPVSLMTYMS
jgi:hypothetical protein